MSPRLATIFKQFGVSDLQAASCAKSVASDCQTVEDMGIAQFWLKLQVLNEWSLDMEVVSKSIYKAAEKITLAQVSRAIATARLREVDPRSARCGLAPPALSSGTGSVSAGPRLFDESWDVSARA